MLHPVRVFVFLIPFAVQAASYGTLRGVVHDPDHRPISGASVVVKSASSDFTRALTSNDDGAFESTALPVGDYRVTVTKEGFAGAEQQVVVSTGSAPVLHFQLALSARTEAVTVSEGALAVSPDVTAPTTMVSRAEIADTPGAGLTNSLAAITDYVPGAWIAHDQLHVRGGHQVTWAIDGVPIPNTNIASNVGPQIDPKDIDYLEAERGGYSAAYGDRTYGVFNVVPRTGFEANNEGELFTTFGTFHQTNDQVDYGSHTSNLAWFGSIDANRSDYGLQTPGPAVDHDRVWGLGGLGTLIYNRGASDQFRLVTSVRRDDYQVPDSADLEHERDAVAEFSWVRTFSPGASLSVSPFYHFNQANYDGESATQHRQSEYGGAQIAYNRVTAKHDASAGVYGFAQRDDESIGILTIAQDRITTGQLAAVYLEDRYKPLSFLTLTAGIRLTHFGGALSENAATPRLGGSLRLPGLNWVLHGFWGEYYQAPPLSTVTGPLLAYATAQGLGFIPLHGERDQEHQVGLTIPVRGWSLDVNNYHQRARNYFDHNAIGDSNIFFPLTIDGARLYGWEVTVRSPRIARRGEVYVTYAHAHAEGEGAISGGLTDFSPPDSGYFPLDHDQRDTLHTGFHFTFPRGLLASTDVYYGSGFTDADPHTTVDFSLGKTISEGLTVSATALNLTNRRFLLDNSPTFGGSHYADPRQFFVQVRYKFHW